MDYAPYDSSGTDDDFPPPQPNRMSRGGGRISGNGRSAPMGSMPYPRMHEETDMEAKIHQLEQEAYISVLRAFKAQADAITWEKETLMTELRKELRLSNEEHGDLLRKVNDDETIRRIREWRKPGGLPPGLRGAGQAVHDPLPSPSVSASRKKQKITPPSAPPQSFGGPSPSFRPQMMANQPSSSAAKRGGPMTGPKGKKQRTMAAGSSSMQMQYPVGPAGRGQSGNRMSSGGFEPAEGVPPDSFVGRKVRTRWPDDNNFYEAVINEYNPVNGLHALVYETVGNATELTYEWVNLSEISPDDIQWDDEDPGVSRRGGYGAPGPGHGMNRPLGRENPPGGGRGRGMAKGQSRKEFPLSQNGIGKKGPEDIQLLHTDTLIKEVERVFGAAHPDLAEIEKAKKVLKEHEQALTEAIARLNELSDGESDEGGRFLHGQAMERE